MYALLLYHLFDCSMLGLRTWEGFQNRFSALMSALKLAVVGGGPSAFFVASRLLQLLPLASYPPEKLQIDIYDRLWAPHGLVRYGVAPDHPEVKVCLADIL
jgi:hypothetical protein